MMTEQELLFDLQDELVRRAESLVWRLQLRRGEGAEQGKNQASRALDVAKSAGSLSVLINWLRYQAGREKSSFWVRPCGDQPLVRAVAQELGWLSNQVAARMPDDGFNRQQRNQATMRGTTLFLGYFRRALIGADYLDLISPERKGEQDATVGHL